MRIIKEENRPVFKDIKLAGQANASIDLGVGEHVISINDVNPENSVMGLGISHVFSGESGTNGTGTGFKLNLEEKLVLNTSTNGEYSHLYVDGNGRTYSFTEYYYYFDEEGQKVYTNTTKSNISVEPDGRLYDGEREVFVEYRSATGYQTQFELKGLKNIELYNQNIEEVKNQQNLVNNMLTELNKYIMVSLLGTEVTMNLEDYMDTYDNFKTFMAYTSDMDYYLISRYDEFKFRQAAMAMDGSYIYFRSTSDQNAIYIEKLYRQYVDAKEKLRWIELYTPINFLSNGKVTKGFNEKGKLVSIKDNSDNTVAIEYENIKVNGVEVERIKKLLSSKEKEVRFEYLDNGKLSAIVDVKGNRTEFTYSDEKLSEIKKSNGDQYVITYEGDKIKSIEENRSGIIGTITYGESNEIVEIKHNSGYGVTKNGLNEETTVETVIRIANTTTEDSQNVVIEDVESKTKEKYVFDLDKELIAYYVETDGVVTQAEHYEYVPYYVGKIKQENPRAKVSYANKNSLYKTSLENFVFSEEEGYVATLNEDKQVELKTYNPIYVDGAESNRKFVTVEYKYGKDKQLVEEKMTTTYDHLPDVVEISFVNYFYNEKGVLIKKVGYIQGEENLYGKNIQEWIYDEKGNLLKEFKYNSLDSTSKYYAENVYSDEGELEKKKDVTGDYETELVFAEDLLTEEKLPNESKYAYGYDEDGRVTAISHSTVSGEANSTEKVYNNGVMTMLTSGNNKVEYSYDAKRRVKAIKLNDTENYLVNTYVDNTTLDGKNVDKTVTTNAKGESETIYVDKKGNLIQVDKGSNIKAKYTYNENNQLSTIQDNIANINHSYAYDQKFIETNHTFGLYSTEKTYDILHNLTELVISKNNAPRMTYQYGYSQDSKRRLISTSVEGLNESYEYDALGRTKKTSISFGENTLSKVRGYQKSGDHTTDRTSSLYYLKNGISDGKITYKYDNMGNVISISENGVQKVKYKYDKLNRLVKEIDIAKDKEICYTIDNEGNILTKSVGGVVKEYKYLDNSDKLVEFDGQSFVYDTIGNPTTYRNKTLVWENGRQLKSYQDGDTVYTYTYDCNALRTSKTVNGETTNYVYENGRLLREENSVYSIDYIYGKDGIIGIKVNDVVYLFRKNIFGDVTHIYDTNGTLIGKYSYTAYGECSIDLQENSVVSINPIRYRSYYYDSETNLYYLKSRYYDPETGRFITIDDTSYLAPDVINGLNLYAYCGNNPVMNVDPDGTFLLALLVGAIAGAAVGGIIGSLAPIEEVKVENVSSVHHTKDLIEDESLATVGNISYTVTEYDKSGGAINSYSDVGNDGVSSGVGFNMGDVLGVSVYTDGSSFSAKGQVTPWLVFGNELGINGSKVSIGIKNGNTMHEISITIGWGGILFALFPGLVPFLSNPNPVSG